MRYKMNFKRWLIEQNKSESTAQKYNSVIYGSFKKWLPSYEVPTNLIDFLALKQELEELSTYSDRNKKGNNMYSAALNCYEQYIKDSSNQIAIHSQDSLQQLEQKRLVKVRLAQQKFRKNVFDINNKCIITDCVDESLLIASHIKPWAQSTELEKIDGYNGLLLTPTYDRLFDKGLMTFGENNQIIYSPKLSQNSKECLHLLQVVKFDFHQKHKIYLKYHRDNIFQH